MNWLYLITMAYIVISALRGFHKGFLREVYGLLSLLATIVFVAVSVPLISDMLQEYTPIYGYIATGSEDYVREQINKNIEEGTLRISSGLTGLALPEGLEEELSQSTDKAILKILESERVYEKLSEQIAGFCIKLIASALAMAIISLVLVLVGRKLHAFSKVPVVHILNMAMGFLVGAAKAFVVICLFFYLVRITAFLSASDTLIGLIEENSALKNLYENNPLQEALQRFI